MSACRRQSNIIEANASMKSSRYQGRGKKPKGALPPGAMPTSTSTKSRSNENTVRRPTPTRRSTGRVTSEPTYSCATSSSATNQSPALHRRPRDTRDGTASPERLLVMVQRLIRGTASAGHLELVKGPEHQEDFHVVAASKRIVSHIAQKEKIIPSSTDVRQDAAGIVSASARGSGSRKSSAGPPTIADSPRRGSELTR